MNIVNSRSRILSVASRWEEQYARDPDPRRVEVLRKLQALDLTTVPASEVDAIIGNDTWTRYMCDHCSALAEWALEIEELTLCRGCVAEAASFLPCLPK